MSKARTLATTVSNGNVLADGTVNASEIGSLTLPTGGDIVGTTSTQTLTNKTVAYADNTLTGVQPTLVSGTSIKTVNSTSLLGSGDVSVQPTLVSGTNIKTVNSQSLLGSGNISIPLTSPAGTTGQVQINSSGAFGAVGSGTAGQVLTSAGAGAAPTFATPPAAGSMVFISSVTASSSTTVQFTNIDSTYDVYVIELVTAIPAVNTDQLRMRFSSNNGSTYFSGGSDYAFSWMENGSNAPTPTGNNSNSINHIPLASVSSSVFGAGVSGFIKIFNPARAAYTLVLSDFTFSPTEIRSQQNRGSAVVLQSAAKNAVQLYFGSGNIASGTFRLYGIKNS
jgi:hypothetical protein